MSDNVKRYTADGVDVTYNVRRCIHAAECVRGLPRVFNTAQRPWIQPGNAAADAVAEVVQRCPTGALHYVRKDGGSAESPPPANRIVVSADGPLAVRGEVQLALGADEAAETRLSLCRCGQSANKPYCDNSHQRAGFSDAGHVRQGGASAAPDDAAPGDGPLHITPAPNGPLRLRGRFELVSADGTTHFHGERALLCRCGGSANKPFCDGSHTRNGFNS